MTDRLPDLSRTEEAIRRFDDYATMIENIERTRFANQSEIAELARRGEAVGIAFGEDTKDRNNPDTCRKEIRPGPRVAPVGMELTFVRRMVLKWRESQLEKAV